MIGYVTLGTNDLAAAFGSDSSASVLEGNDDVAAMEEVVRRRLAYWADEQTASKFRRADLIIIDGGLPQLHAAQKAAATLDLHDVEFAALAKREELLYRPGSSAPIALERGSESLYLVQRVRDEAHRFAIAGHRRKRAKRHSQSILETIPGLGPVKRRELLKQFGGLQGILRAGIDDFAQIRGLGRDLAEVIYEHLHPGQ